MSKLKLGVIGISEGNGHPYSWSAIFNGYNAEYMKDCPFPVIPDYLSKQQFPQDSLADLATVTHVWCPDKSLATHIAKSSNIHYVVDELKDMVDAVDAVLLARDDAATHYEYALPFLQSGKPIFIDKPLAVEVNVAKKIWAAQKFDNQVFTCSSLRFANELLLTEEEKETIGTINLVEGSVMKKWETYAIHVLEPIIAQLPTRGELKNVQAVQSNEIKQVLVQWENVTGYFKTTGSIPTPLEIKFFGAKGNITKTFFDSFNAFKNSLSAFIEVVHHPEKNIDKKETLELVTILEKGQA